MLDDVASFSAAGFGPVKSVVVLDPQQAEAKLQKQIAFGALINRIMARFVSCAGSEIDYHVQQALQEVCQFIGADAGFVIELSSDQSTWTLTYDWHASAVPDINRNLRRVPLGVFAWTEQQLFEGKTVRLRTLEDLPPEAAAERQSYESQGVKSHLNIPLHGQGEQIIGCIGFRSYFQPIEWAPEIDQWIQLACDAIENVLHRKRTEQSLRESEQRFRTIANNLPGFTYQFFARDDGTWGVYYVDERSQDTFDLPVEPLGTWVERFIACVAPEDRDRFVTSIQEVVRTHSPWDFEGKFIKPTGGRKHIKCMSQPVQVEDETIWNGLLLDVTDRKQAEDKFTKAFQSSPSILAITRIKDHCVVAVNDSFETISGYSREEVIGHQATEIGLWQDPSERERLLQRLAVEGTVRNEECHFRIKNGDIFIGLTSMDTIEIDDEGCYLVVIIDITEQKRAENALRQSEERFRRFAEASLHGFGMCELAGQMIYLNAAAYRILEEDPGANIAAKTFYQYYMPADQERLRNEILPILLDKGQWAGEFMLVSTQGKLTPTEQSIFLIRDEQGVPLMIGNIATDITERKQAEERLLNAEKELQEVINGSPVPSFVIDRNHNLTHWNEAIERLTGFKSKDVLGAPYPSQQLYGNVRPCMADVLLDSKMEEMDRLYAGKYQKSEALENTFQATDYFPTLGERGKWLTFSASLLKDAQGSVIGAIETLVDITDRKQAEERLLNAQTELSEVINGSPIPTFVIDTNHIVTHWNEAAEKITGYKTKDVLGTAYPWKAFYDHPRPCMADLLLDSASEEIDRLYVGKYKKSEILENTFEATDFFPPVGKDGKWLTFTASLLKDAQGNVIGAIETLEDVTNRVLAEKEVKQYQDHLEELVEDRTRELEASRKEALQLMQEANVQKQRTEEAMLAAETANRAKSIFLANMSHELRTPLTAVLGFTQLLYDDSTLGEHQRENLEIVHRSGEHLLELINDILDISKIEAGRIGVQETVFDLRHVLETIEEMMRIRANAKGVQFLLQCDLDLPRYVRTDAKKLRQILINLAGNAVKYTQEGNVVLRVRQDGQENVLYCEVEDTGSGIQADDLPKLFDRFIQVGQSHEGVGLGLYISRKLVELLGGRISVESTWGKGSKFFFHIHCKPCLSYESEHRRAKQKVLGLAPGQRAPRVLIAEDKLETRIFVTRILETAGFQVIQAENGQEAITQFETNQPDLILMDMRMPVLDGYGAMRQIKSTERGKTTPIIAVTASAFDEERAKIISAGADDYLGKPIQVEELFDKIQAHLGIVYTYADAQPSATFDGTTRLGEMVARLPESMVANLTAAISTLDIDQFKALLPEVSSYDSALSEQLKKMAEGCEIAKLATLFKARKKTPV